MTYHNLFCNKCQLISLISDTAKNTQCTFCKNDLKLYGENNNTIRSTL